MERPVRTPAYRHHDEKWWRSLGVVWWRCGHGQWEWSPVLRPNFQARPVRARDNALMPLTGAEYQRLTQTAPTLDSETDGRWIACDESGYDGEDLLSDGRYLMVAGVAVDDAEAELIVRELRKETHIQPTVRDLKFKHFQRGDRLEKLSRAMAARRRTAQPLFGVRGRQALWAHQQDHRSLGRRGGVQARRRPARGRAGQEVGPSPRLRWPTRAEGRPLRAARAGLRGLRTAQGPW